MADEPEEIIPFKQKLLFYITAFFVLLAIFSLFAFLFLVPFVIEPAFTTIMMEFDEIPAFCVTVEVEHFKGASNCSWTSCREGCTKEVYECTQIRVNYKVFPRNTTNDTMYDDELDVDATANDDDARRIDGSSNVHHLKVSDGKTLSKSMSTWSSSSSSKVASTASVAVKRQIHRLRAERGIREYDYVDGDAEPHELNKPPHNGIEFMEYPDGSGGDGSGVNKSEWFYTGAKLFPNVKGCGYPPILNCTIWGKKYKTLGSNFSCYYSRTDPGLVISDLDLKQNTLNLIYATCIPIPSFIVSVIYLTFAYFKIYNEDEESAPLDQNAEDIADDEEVAAAGDDAAAAGDESDTLVANGTKDMASASADQLTPTSDLNSFGHQLNVKMADEMSRESLDGGLLSNSGSLQG